MMTKQNENKKNCSRLIKREMFQLKKNVYERRKVFF